MCNSVLNITRMSNNKPNSPSDQKLTHLTSGLIGFGLWASNGGKNIQVNTNAIFYKMSDKGKRIPYISKRQSTKDSLT